MESLLQHWQNLWVGYPDWLAFSVLAVGCVILIWLLAKLLALFLKLALIGTVIFVVLGVLVHFFA